MSENDQIPNDNPANDHADHNDAFFQQTIGALDSDAATPNRDLMTAATLEAGKVFSDHQQVPDDSNPNKTSEKDSKMISLARPLSAIAAIAAAVSLIIAFNPGAMAGTTLGEVLDRLHDNKGLKLEVFRDGTESEVIVSGDAVRWQKSDDRYQIARGSRLWQIDESENTVEGAANPWAAAEGKQIDLLALLGSQSTEALRAVRAESQTQHAGTLCNVYLFQPKPSASELAIRCFVDAQTNELYTIACWPPEADPNAQPPLAELRLVQRDLDVDESLFVVRKALSKDGRIAKITESQGVVSLRPKTHRRWTPVVGPMMVKTGDWIRTDNRGANATSIVTTSGCRIIAGPGTLLELNKPDRTILHHGEVNIAVNEDAENDFTLTVLASAGKDEQTAVIAGGKRSHISIDRDGNLQTIQAQPKWLAGFEGSTNEESLGSLVAKIDGRDVTLTVGYHKVSVEIRDQIARTTIEESFVNHTVRRLEGQFYFPLPQDASISGFGMWINGELIEADVVEKQRAREIYETILRERRDPGLLEWAGGNLFKARVFPIEGNAEKRIKIVYTQVLPMRGNQYRYSYALRSEMLQKTPLRELLIDVQVASKLPLQSVTCPTHSVRTDIAQHAASVEFAAQQYTPSRDFEIVCQVAQPESDVVVVPHRRGDDGYFLAQVTPPSPEGNWQRDVLADGDPVNVMMVCDTSGSMDRDTRKKQEEFVATLLSSLGEDDRFSIAVCDVQTQWLSSEETAVSEESIDRVTKLLDQRPSLGWTDLDAMAASVVERLNARSDGQQTHVIYIGDGIATARDANPQACAGRLQRSLAGAENATIHAVSIGNTFESGVLRALAGVGGGSVRQIDGERTPQRTANELLMEITRPGISDLKLEFRGINVAAIYPDRLPNLSAGTQQIIVGRYLPKNIADANGGQSGEIIITGNRGGQDVRYASRVTLADSESGNSFIPRLWARAHLDHLLQQGSGEFIQDEVIALSEEFHIMTPYTSLLVLESDADRERFGVKRRFLIRDGERFFADGRNEASFELLQQQMKAAGNWRLQLRQQVLRDISQMGRMSMMPRTDALNDQLGLARPVSTAAPSRWGGMRSSSISTGGFGGGGEVFSGFVSDQSGLDSESDELRLFEDSDDLEKQSWRSASGSMELQLGAMEELAEPASSYEDAKGNRESERSDFGRRRLNIGRGSGPASFLLAKAQQQSLSSQLSGFDRPSIERFDSYFAGGYFGGYTPDYISWFDQLLPSQSIAPKAVEPAESDWPEDVTRLVESLLQPLRLDDGQGVEVKTKRSTYDARWDRLRSESLRLQLTNLERWLSSGTNIGSDETTEWCDENERSIVSQAWHLGRKRASKPTDLQTFHPGERMGADESFTINYATWSAEIIDGEDKTVTLKLTHTTQPGYQQEFVIDRKRNVILESRYFHDGAIQSRVTYTDHVQAAGGWWPQTITHFDDQDRKTAETQQTVRVLAKQAFEKRYRDSLPNPAVIHLFSRKMPTVAEARTADAGATAGFDDYVMLLLDACRIQSWDAAFGFLEKLERLAPEKAGVLPIQRHLLVLARRNAEALEFCRSRLNKLAKDGDPSELYITNRLISQAQSYTDNNERLALLDIAEPIYRRQSELVQTDNLWQLQQYQVQCLQSLQRVDEAIKLRRQMIQTSPWNVGFRTALASLLAQEGQYEEALDGMMKQINGNDPWSANERSQLYDAAARILRDQSRHEELIALLEQWLDTRPTNQDAYSQYIAALVANDQANQANRTIEQWMRSSLRDEELPDWELTRLRKAINFALGQESPNYRYKMDPRWYQPLSEMAEHFLASEHHIDVVQQFLTNQRFQDTPEAKQARQQAANLLNESAADLSPARVAVLISLVGDDSDLTGDDWRTIASVLHKRWIDEVDPKKRNSLGSPLVSIYLRHVPPSELIDFLKARVDRSMKAKSSEFLIQEHVNDLFITVLRQPWSEEIEATLFEVLTQTHQSDDPQQRLATWIDRLQQVIDAMREGRVAAAELDIQSDGHPEKLTRRELSQRRREFRQAALSGLVKRLASERKQLTKSIKKLDSSEAKLQSEFSQWMWLQQLHFTVLAADSTKPNRFADNGELGRVAKQCRKLMGEQPIALPDEDSGEDAKENTEASALLLSHSLRQERATSIMSNLALRRGAPDAWRDDVLAYINRGMELSGENAVAWKNRYRSLLIALDRPQQLEQNLRVALVDSRDRAPLQRMLARLLAEQGNINDAIRLIEASKSTAPMSPDDLALLAKWYTVADRPDDARRAKVDTFLMMEEYQIGNWLRQEQQLWTRGAGQLPSELDKDVLFAFQAIFEKSQSPQNYLYQLHSFYTASRDFRLLRMIPDAVVGRTPQQIYPFINQLRSQILEEIRDEATADELLKRLETIRQTAKSTTDLRALDLLEAEIERRAGKVLNQPGPHAKAAVAALKQAFNRQWADREELQMAKYLADMGTIPDEDFRAEQRRQLRTLHAELTEGSDTHLQISSYLAKTLYLSEQTRDEAVAVMEIALRQYHAVNGAGLPQSLNGSLNSYIELLEWQQRFQSAETVLVSELDHARTGAQAMWVKTRLNRCRVNAYQRGSAVSLGEGTELYHNLLDSLVEEMQATNKEYLKDVADLMVSLLGSTQRRDAETYAEDIRRYAFEQLPNLLPKLTDQYGNTVRAAHQLVDKELGPREAFAFLIERLENYPTRFEGTWNSGWQQFASSAGKYRRESKNAKKLEKRFLKIALDNLRRKLIVGDPHNQAIFYRHGSGFWKEKESDFARVADQVAAEYQDSSKVVVFVSRYLFDRLNHYDRAIELMIDANQRGIFEQDNQLVLVRMLQQRDRWGESVPLLRPMVKSEPKIMSHRVLLLRALNGSRQTKQLDKLLTTTEAFFREQQLWNEENLAKLAEGVYRSEMYKVAIRLYGELIPLHQRTQSIGANGDEPLSEYYQNLARSYANRRDTIEAVDAAASAVVAWGPRQRQRKQAILTLKSVMISSRDRDGLIDHLDQQAEETGTDSALIRKVLGMLLVELKEPEKAIGQLRIAIDLQPTDPETHEALIKALDDADRPGEATKEMLLQFDFDRHNLELSKRLAKRFKNDETMAERAVTSIVEAAPLEAENHQAIAEIRQDQDRWGEAIEHWKKVASLREREPSGLLQLAKAQIHEKQWQAAKATIKRIEEQAWPERFSNIENETRQLQRKIRK